eukprot:5632385-Pleurochrysis_carterae.AAC.1
MGGPVRGQGMIREVSLLTAVITPHPHGGGRAPPPRARFRAAQPPPGYRACLAGHPYHGGVGGIDNL